MSGTSYNFHQQNNCSSSSHLYGVIDHHDDQSSFEPNSSGSATHTDALLYSLSVLKSKVQQIQSLVANVVAPDHHRGHGNVSSSESMSISIDGMCTLIQDIIVTASSMMYTCQQLSLGAAAAATTSANNNQGQLPHEGSTTNHVNVVGDEDGQKGLFYMGDHHQSGLHSFANASNHYNLMSCNNNIGNTTISIVESRISTGVVNKNNISNMDYINRDCTILSEDQGGDENEVVVAHDHDQIARNEDELLGYSPWNNCDIIELNASDLLAKYTHYCQVCGKGFKRDANLRMHMRAHGDEYKSREALTNPMKKTNINSRSSSSSITMTTNNSNSSDHQEGLKRLATRKYSCPQEGCRWNRKHAKFQPLKSVICVKNHYKRSHCPKMYVCNRCNQKQFSVLSDLRTHEKHCGDVKWQCSCGTTFSRKDKLMGHIALFFGHTPVGNVINVVPTNN
ncbi:hypothetical protein Syun_000691 [Stephania yunnanensis]|uniref:C2H2-type domain-containing protein n=1 Tax=Stephania yunnanensis TaxID=152371 RepID=A0AAP0QA57_9MAGN